MRYIRFYFAYGNTEPYGRARWLAQDALLIQLFRWREIRRDGKPSAPGGGPAPRLVSWARPTPLNFLECVKLCERIVRGWAARVNWSGCEFCACRWKKSCRPKGVNRKRKTQRGGAENAEEETMAQHARPLPGNLKKRQVAVCCRLSCRVPVGTGTGVPCLTKKNAATGRQRRRRNTKGKSD